MGRVDILLEVSLISSYITCPYIGHMKVLIHMFAFLKSKPKLTIAFDPRHPFTEESRFVKCDWSNIYPDAQEDIPSDLPPPLKKDVTSTCFVDASHGSNLKNRRSQTGILIFYFERLFTGIVNTRIRMKALHLDHNLMQ